MRIQIVSIDVNSDECPDLMRFHLESPETDVNANTFALRFHGWFINRDLSVRRVSIDYQGEPLDFVAPVPRPDVVAAYPDIPAECVGGFEAVVPVLALRGDVLLTIKLHSNQQVQCAASVQLSVKPLHVEFEPRRSPVLLTSGGRTGSTLAMALISSHPQIITQGTLPFENKSALYWLHAASVLTMPTDARSVKGFDFEDNRFSTGFNPYFNRATVPEAHSRTGRWLDESLPSVMYNHFMNVVDNYYDAVAGDCGKETATLFIEKAFYGLVPFIVRELYPKSKEIFLIRDPRDTYVSTRAFHKKWGYQMYAGREEFNSEEEHINYLSNNLKNMIKDWERRKDNSLLIRYEDLLADAANVTRKIFEYLEVSATDEIVQTSVERAFRKTDAVKAHMTSSSVADSVSRWRTELPDDLRGHCNSVFRPFLQHFGYE